LGIHRITAIAGDAQRNFDFYSKVMGLRFIKKTVNFDNPNTCHFYFGDQIGMQEPSRPFFPGGAIFGSRRQLIFLAGAI